MEAMNESLPSQGMLPPECTVFIILGGPPPSSATELKVLLIFLAVISTLTIPFTAALNALVIVAVKTKSRMRALKSNILLACLAATDLMVGVIVQPMFIALMTMIIRGKITTRSCVFQKITQLFTSALCDTSLIHLALISGERYLAMKYTFLYNTELVTEARLLTCSALAWLFSLILRIPLIVDRNAFFFVTNVFTSLCISFVIFCQITVYREVRRHEKQLSTQQVTEEARQKFLKDKKAFKLTVIIVSLLLICYIPVCVFRVILRKLRGIMSIQAAYACVFSAIWLVILNSFLNPIVYSVRMRQFRVALVELTCRTRNIVEAEEIEMRVFGSHNAVGQAGGRPERAEQNAEQGLVNNHSNDNNEMLAQHKILSNNWTAAS